jgi:4-hydroxy 2-oxovalerate aldolase
LEEKMKLPFLLDCTLRDGGYYTNWDFDKNIVDEYIKATNALPIDYIEVGYRNNPSKEYLGKYGYCPVYALEDIRNKSTKKIAIMLNEKSLRPSDLSQLLGPIKTFVDMVRIAIDPQNFDRAVILAEKVKEFGFQVGFNVMHMSKWKEYNIFPDKLTNINGIADLFYMVDSFGGVSPKDIKEILSLVKEKTTCKTGFHGHNNLELGLINTLTAIDNEIDYVDSTILGMGRGAGNLKTELLLTCLNRQYGLDVDFNVLGDVITAFAGLLDKYKWGTNLPYMLSGANSLPQKNIMEWVNNRWYSFNNIVRALDNKKTNVADNAKYPVIKTAKFDTVIIVGGGTSAASHSEAIKEFIRTRQSIAMVFATTKNAACYQDLDIPQFYCLVGREGKRLHKVFSNISFKGKCILPPYPREMGTDVPTFVQDVTFELPHVEFTEKYFDSCTSVAMQTAVLFCNKDLFLAGYDGYTGSILSDKEASLTNENRLLFDSFKTFYNKPLVSLTPSLYKELDIQSVYQYL